MLMIVNKLKYPISFLYYISENYLNIFPMLLHSEFFSKRLYCAQYLSIFSSVAQTITQEYIEDVYLFIDEHGYVPDFTYFIEKTQTLTNDLTLRAKWMRDEYKEGRGGVASITLTTSCKRIIKKSIADYLNVIKTLRNINQVYSNYK